MVGATGHRLLAEPDKLRRVVCTALDAIAEAYPERHIVVVTQLAEGADRLVTQAAVAQYGAKVSAVLPMDPDEFEKDFVADDSRREYRRLLAIASNREVVEDPQPSDECAGVVGGVACSRRYHAASCRMLELSNVLIALWDGKDAQGPGGTGAVVRAARSKGLPLAHIYAGNRIPGTEMPTTLGIRQGWLTLERFRRSCPPKPP